MAVSYTSFAELTKEKKDLDYFLKRLAYELEALKQSHKVYMDKFSLGDEKCWELVRRLHYGE